MNRAGLDRAVRALLAGFRRQRPLRSGSLLVTILGDAIAPRGGAVTLGSLIKLAGPFGLPERLVRTSVGRLAKDGWLTSRRAGRQSEYALTKHGRQRFAEATQRIYSEPPRDWDQRWTMLLLPVNSANHREKIREELRWLGFGQVTAGVLAHPSRSIEDTQDLLDEMGMKGRAIVLQAQSATLAQARELISAGWDLAELASGYRRFVARFSGIYTLLRDGVQADPSQAFVIRTLLIHEYRKIHLRDPLLPHELLPPDWIGADAYDLCRQLYRRVFEKAEDYLSVNAARLNEPLVALTRENSERFRIRHVSRKD
jgi:phenylacetic acid degradation operon negative regulatory protein